MARTFMQRVAEAQAELPIISPDEAKRRLDADANTLVVDVRDASDVRKTGIIPGAEHISLGTLLFKADHSLPAGWQHPALADHERPIITTCETSEMASIGAKELKDLGFTNVAILQGGTVGWQQAGLPTRPFTGE
jgi:rhodanese-related sulfurtransferase